MKVSRKGRMRRRGSVLSNAKIESTQLGTLTEEGGGGGVAESAML